jgi:hypothetical protein
LKTLGARTKRFFWNFFENESFNFFYKSLIFIQQRLELGKRLENQKNNLNHYICSKSSIYETQNHFPYNKALVAKARYLRNHSTLSEILLWKHLKGKQMLGYDFDRQKTIDNFIVDFFCNELQLIIRLATC